MSAKASSSSIRISEGRELRRARIAEVAMRLFGERGFSAVSVEDIAAAAGYTRASVYNHFRGKPMIYLYIIGRDTELLATSIARRVEAAATGAAAFDALLDALIAWVEAQPSFFFMYFVARAEVERDMTPAQRRTLEESHFRLLELVRQVFQRAISEGAFRDIEAPTATNLFFASFVGAILLHGTHSFRASLPQLLRAGAHYFLRGVSAAQGSYPLEFFAKRPER